jgi:hypothetical protein
MWELLVLIGKGFMRVLDAPGGLETYETYGDPSSPPEARGGNTPWG